MKKPTIVRTCVLCQRAAPCAYCEEQRTTLCDAPTCRLCRDETNKVLISSGCGAIWREAAGPYLEKTGL